MINLSTLVTAYESGATKAEKGSVVSGDVVTAYIAGTEYNIEQMEALAQGLGWIEHYAPVFDILQFTNTFARDIKSLKLDETTLENTYVEFQNRASMGYNKTFERIVIESKNRRFKKAIIHGMYGSSAKYEIYKVGNALVESTTRTQRAALKNVFNMEVKK